VKDDTLPKKILLNVTVFNNRRDRKPVANAAVKMLSKNLADVNVTADASGRVTGIALGAEKSYELGASLAARKSVPAIFNTIGIRKDTTLEKELYLDSEAGEQELSGDCFTFYFSYNMNAVDENAADYKQFIEKVLAAKNAGGKIVLKANASASSVPTRQFRSNQELAQARANATLEKIRNSLKQKGLAEGDIQVAVNKAFVSGPAYKGDYANTEKYGKYQYVKVCLTP
jgi:hypothetical protein